MLKIGIKKEEEVLSVKFRLVQDEPGGAVYVEDTESGFSIIGFKVVNGEVNFFRCTSVSDANFDTDSSGRIEEVNE